jgi:hypothetical protein
MLTKTRVLRSMIMAVIWIALWYSSASAHGGIAGPDELGPPVITAAALGIGGYWTVMLWPSRRDTQPRSKTMKRGQNRLSRKVSVRY